MSSKIKINSIFQLIIIITSISMLLMTVNCYVESIGTARNLSVEVFEDLDYYETIDNDGNIPNRLLKMSISWLPPDRGKTPASYSVTVSSFYNESFMNTMGCPEEVLYYTTEDENQLKVQLPENPIIYGVPEFAVVPGCTYSVQVFANPRTDPKLQHPVIEYTVPDCVGAECSCASKTGESLPWLEVEVQKVNDTQFCIKWEPLISNEDINSYTISFGVPILVSRSGLPVYNTTKIASISPQTNSYLWINDDTNVIGMIYVAAEDSRGCKVFQGTYSIDPILRSIPLSQTKILIIFIASLVISIFILVIICAMRTQDRRKYSLAVSRAHSERYSTCLFGIFSTQKLSTRNFPSLRRNAFYVEQEVEEAICKGEADVLEISYSRIHLHEELGRGEFGKVFLAALDGGKSTLVAVKMANSLPGNDNVNSRVQLLEEIEIMKAAGSHPHLVELIGCCTLSANPVCAILEYMKGGDLLNYLHRIREHLSNSLNNFSSSPTSRCNPRPSLAETLCTILASEPPTTPTTTTVSVQNGETLLEKTHNYVNVATSTSNSCSISLEKKNNIFELEDNEFLRFAMEIAQGMRHLEAKGITHRDLAARNILLDANLTLKISDFGLSRNGVYVIGGSSKVRRLPVRWMSPEAMRDREFSSKSDVWSYAVVLWEIGTLGAFPYSDVRDDQLLRHVVADGKRLVRPDAISVRLYSLMQACWASKPQDRPDFNELLSHLSLLGSASYLPYGKNNPCYSALPPTEEELQSSPIKTSNIFNF